MTELEVIKIAPAGLGYGEGGISYEQRKEEVGVDSLRRIEEAINSSDILTPVSTDKDGILIDDDGCGDGRNVSRVFEGTEERKKSLIRPKVFGGGATMATASLIGTGKADGLALREAFSAGMATMRDHMIGFGAHTDTHAHGSNCGCGAIDKAPVIIENALKFREEIQSSIQALGIDTAGLDDVMSSFGRFATTMQPSGYEGSDVMGEIIDNGKVVKELDDNHKEMVVILNLVDGYSVDQEKVRNVSDNNAQAFAVDVWRVKQIADRLYAGDSEETRQKAFLSELVYTLATAATLTKGDLPVYVISKSDQTVAA